MANVGCLQSHKIKKLMMKDYSVFDFKKMMATQKGTYVPYKYLAVKLSYNEILYLEAAKSYTVFHTAKRKYLVSKSLNTTMAKMDSKFFFRISKSLGVNILHIKAFYKKISAGSVNSWELKMSDESALIISRRKQKPFEQFLKNFMYEYYLLEQQLNTKG